MKEKLRFPLRIQLFAEGGTDSVDILNAIRSVAGDDYSARVPEATRENIASVGNTILSYTPNTNLFLTSLMNRIGRVVIKKLDTMDDIYSLFGEERLEFGDTIQKVFVDIPTAHAFEGTSTLTPASMLAVEKGVIHVEYTSVDRRLYYKTTISVPELKEAFVSVSALDSLVMGLIEGMTRALAVDKYIMDTNTLGTHAKYILALRNAIVSASGTPNVKVIEVPETVAKYNKTSGLIEWTSVGAKEFLKLLRKASGGLNFYHKLDYAPYDVSQGTVDITGTKKKTISAIRTPKKNQVLALEVDSLAEIDVDALAVLFNLQKADIQTQVIEVQNQAFGLVGSSTAERYIGGFICDKGAVERGTSFEDSDSFKNPEHEYVNFWNHYWGYRAVSKFADFVPIVFKTYTPEA